MSTINRGGGQSIYDNSLKIAVARDYLNSELGYGKLGEKYGLAGKTVRHFVRWYKAHYDVQVSLPQQAPVTSSGPEVELLRKQLEEANLKVAALEIMMEIAKKELGVDIVKKFGTKQSSR
jgi:transposase-like protein